MTLPDIQPRALAQSAWANGRKVAPGLAATVVVALAATYLSDHYRTPVMIFALLLGIALNALSTEAGYEPGITLSSRTLLRLSVALLGLRVTFSEILELGWETAAMVVLAVSLTIGFGWLVAKLLKIDPRFGVLSGGAVGVCGASAAMAIAVAWPRKESERDTVVVIAAITALSTVAMVVYPVIAAHLHLSPLETGRFLGGSIHDVAQVVGSGFSVSERTGEVATVVKLMRVAMLLPVVFLITIAVARKLRQEGAGEGKITLLPWFLVVFVLLAAANGAGVVPKAVAGVLTEASKWLLVVSVAALGMKTSAKDIMAVGKTAVGLVVAETAFIALFVLGWIALGG